MQLRASLRLLHRIDEITARLQFTDGFKGRRAMTPVDAVLSAERSLVNFRMRRSARDATQNDLLHAESVAGAQYAAHVVHAPHIVEDDDKRQFFSLAELVHAKAVHLDGLQFTHIPYCFAMSFLFFGSVV